MASVARSMHEAWTVRMRHRGVQYELDVHSDELVSRFQERVYEATSVRPEHQKLMAQRVPGGPMPTLTRTVQRQEAGATPLEACGLRDGALVTVVGAKDDEINALHEQESAWARRNAPRQLHPSLLRGAKPRSTAMPAPRRVFGQCVVHPNTPSHDRFHGLVLRYLERLASDPAVLHVCRTHGYEVGTLTELLPHEHPNLLGLNENKGQRILLRIRTDAADGTRDYKTTRRVLMHELAHNEVRTTDSRTRFPSIPPNSRSSTAS